MTETNARVMDAEDAPVSADGAVLHVKPLARATTPAAEFNEALRRFSTGLTVGPTDGTYAVTDAGEYEVRAFGPAQVEGVRMTARYCFWEIVRQQPWAEWDRRTAPTETEYAVLHTPPGATSPSLVRCGDDGVLMRQRLFEILEQGGKAEPVTRPAVEWAVDDKALAEVTRDVARAAVIAIAQNVWEENSTLNDGVDELAQYSDLDFVTRTRLLDQLISELTFQELVEDDRVPPDAGQDKQGLLDDAERRINEAADRLIGAQP